LPRVRRQEEAMLATRMAQHRLLLAAVALPACQADAPDGALGRSERAESLVVGTYPAVANDFHQACAHKLGSTYVYTSSHTNPPDSGCGVQYGPYVSVGQGGHWAAGFHVQPTWEARATTSSFASTWRRTWVRLCSPLAT
jgi:hypothetical protein